MIVLVLSFYFVRKWFIIFLYYLGSNLYIWWLYIFLALQSDDEIDEVLEEEIEKQHYILHFVNRHSGELKLGLILKILKVIKNVDNKTWSLSFLRAYFMQIFTLIKGQSNEKNIPF